MRVPDTCAKQLNWVQLAIENRLNERVENNVFNVMIEDKSVHKLLKKRSAPSGVLPRPKMRRVIRYFDFDKTVVPIIL